jgi:hypothetical protein
MSRNIDVSIVPKDSISDLCILTISDIPDATKDLDAVAILAAQLTEYFVAPFYGFHCFACGADVTIGEPCDQCGLEHSDDNPNPEPWGFSTFTPFERRALQASFDGH